MKMLSERAVLIRASIFAHMLGLIVVGFYVTIGTSGGFGYGAWIGMLVGGIISIPWFAVLLSVIWFFPHFYWRNYFVLSLVGAALVCGSWWLIEGTNGIYSIALTALVDSITFLVIISLVRRRKSVET